MQHNGRFNPDNLSAVCCPICCFVHVAVRLCCSNWGTGLSSQPVSTHKAMQVLLPTAIVGSTLLSRLVDASVHCGMRRRLTQKPYDHLRMTLCKLSSSDQLGMYYNPANNQ